MSQTIKLEQKYYDPMTQSFGGVVGKLAALEILESKEKL